MRKALLRANLPFGGKASQPMSLDEYCFKHEPADYNVYWDVRKGLIPIVGAARETGALGRLPRPKSLKGVGVTDTACTGTCARRSSHRRDRSRDGCAPGRLPKPKTAKDAG